MLAVGLEDFPKHTGDDGNPYRRSKVRHIPERIVHVTSTVTRLASKRNLGFQAFDQQAYVTISVLADDLLPSRFGENRH